jgi:hypothetical protein
MSNNDLTGIQLAAALAEHVYRRGIDDNPITLSDLQVTAAPVDGDVAGLTPSSSAEQTFYYSSRGFVGEVVKKDGVFYVVIRGTDSSENFSDGLRKVGLSKNQTLVDTEHKSDLGDWVNNILLGFGTEVQTQLDDALALTRAVEAQAGGAQVVVVGQSLGGGLAGLVSAIEGIKGYAIAPAPFKAQLSIEAQKYAVQQGNLTHLDLPIDIGTSFYGNSSQNIIKILTFNGYTQAQIDRYFTDYSVKLSDLTTSIQTNLEIHTIQGEVLSDGIGALSALIGSEQFPVTRTSYNVGETGSLLGGLTEATPVSLHSPALHNLVIRTHNAADAQAFET